MPDTLTGGQKQEETVTSPAPEGLNCGHVVTLLLISADLLQLFVYVHYIDTHNVPIETSLTRSTKLEFIITQV